MSVPLVSIIIPVYNSEKHLADCIRSAIAQTWAHKEIIVVDDGSMDNSLHIARSFESNGVKALAQENGGASAARNTGLSAAKGDYIQFLDADDLISPDKITGQVNCLQGSLTQLAICKTVHFSDGEDPRQGVESKDWFYKEHADPVDFLIKLYAGEDTLPGYGGMVAIHSWLSPRRLIDKVGPWNESLNLDDDGEFFCRVVLASEGIKFTPAGINYYRKFDNRQNQSAQKSQRAVESAIAAIDLKLAHLKEKTTAPIVDSVFAKHYWWTGVLAYPQFKSLSKYCIEKAEQLGYSGEKYVGGRSGHLLAAILGWKNARLIAAWRQSFKRSWA
ncbi:MAG TPA: glycosyltransferase [Mucilaginibacter sp.]|jgi:glycosyltransferase involved in cell wall biosynthesis|nr:glycosyltransferase [Mucilaginibacter sp.]